MPETAGYEHGVPSWVDMGAHDLTGAVTFYGGLLGWDTQDLGPEAGHYTIASKGGRMVAALAVAQDPGPPRWTTYVNVDDVDEIARRVGVAGGRTLFGPTDVMTAGRMLVFADTTGAVLAAWQPNEHPGAQLVNEPGAFIWSELSTSDLAASRAFYAEVFGWSWGGSDAYAEAQVAGRSVAAAMPRPEGMPPEVPDMWLVYFGSADVDADCDRAGGLGASVAVPPTDVPGAGRFCVLADPEGAVFGLYRP